MVDGLVGAEAPHRPGHVGAGGREDLGARAGRELHQALPDAAGRAHDEDGLPGVDAASSTMASAVVQAVGTAAACV